MTRGKLRQLGMEISKHSGVVEVGVAVKDPMASTDAFKAVGIFVAKAGSLCIGGNGGRVV